MCGIGHLPGAWIHESRQRRRRRRRSGTWLKCCAARSTKKGNKARNEIGWRRSSNRDFLMATNCSAEVRNTRSQKSWKQTGGSLRQIRGHGLIGEPPWGKRRKCLCTKQKRLDRYTNFAETKRLITLTFKSGWQAGSFQRGQHDAARLTRQLSKVSAIVSPRHDLYDRGFPGVAESRTVPSAGSVMTSETNAH